MLTDGAVAELLLQLPAMPAAASLEAIDLSFNQLLTWECCETLGVLLSSGPPAASAAQWQAPNLSACAAAPEHRSSSSSSTHSSDGADNVRRQQQAPPPTRQLQALPPLRVLLLEGVAVGDRGAALLAAGITGSRVLQVRSITESCSGA
jgi:hypothetical protein